MSATTMAPEAVDERTNALRKLLNRRYKYIDRKWDIVFWVTAAFVVAAAADITKLLFAGDWDFWTDWKDRQWWPMVTPFAVIIIPSALQYIQWLAWRMPTGAVYTALCAGIAAWIGRSPTGTGSAGSRSTSSGRSRSSRPRYGSTGSC
jgi:methane/ammonia monooxygenase subunit A